MIKLYFAKFKATQNKPPKTSLSYTIWAILGASLSIGIIAYISNAMNLALLIAPFGATASLIFSPNLMMSSVAQPRSVIGGYLISGILGLLFAEYGAIDWYFLALSVGISLGIMNLLHIVHPPAVGIPLLILLHYSQNSNESVQWIYLFSPILLGSFLLVGIGAIFNNLHKDHQYPKYWK